MSTPFVMPKAGITMDEGTITGWLVQPGQPFREGDALAVVETDKASVEVTANADGVILAILVPEGKTVPVGTPIAEIGPVGAAGMPEGGRVRISPLARSLAAQWGVDPGKVRGTGPGGRVLRRDIEAARVAPTPAPPPAPPPGPAPRIPLGRLRRIIAQRMTSSATTVPQFRVSLEADMTQTLALRDSLLPLKVKLSLTDFLIQATALALREHPGVNASWDPGPTLAESAIFQHDKINIGLAVAVEGGLVVPVVAGAGDLSLVAISRMRESLVAAARAGNLTPDQLAGGTFTISNLGPYGIDSFDAIVNPPEAAILAVGQVVRRPVALEGDRLEVRPMLALTLTSDHRVLDGAAAAAFLRTLADKLRTAGEYRLL